MISARPIAGTNALSCRALIFGHKLSALSDPALRSLLK
jgi:hypothetical protein